MHALCTRASTSRRRRSGAACARPSICSSPSRRRSKSGRARRERELRRLVIGRKNWLFTWLDLGGERTARILSIIASCIAHDVNPRAYLHLVTKLIVHGWPQARLRDLLPDRILVAHPELFVGDRDALDMPQSAPRARRLIPGSAQRLAAGNAFGASAASLRSSSMASRITRSVSSRKCASSSSESARYSGHSV